METGPRMLETAEVGSEGPFSDPKPSEGCVVVARTSRIAAVAARRARLPRRAPRGKGGKEARKQGARRRGRSSDIDTSRGCSLPSRFSPPSFAGVRGYRKS